MRVPDSPISRSAAPAGSEFPLRSNYETSDGTALAGQHYVETSGSVTFNAGEVSKVIQIPIIDDAVASPTLNFLVTLSAAGGTGFVGGQSTATVNIIDNDATTFRFNPATYTVDEGAGTVTLTVEARRVGDNAGRDFRRLRDERRERARWREIHPHVRKSRPSSANVTIRTITVPII